MDSPGNTIKLNVLKVLKEREMCEEGNIWASEWLYLLRKKSFTDGITGVISLFVMCCSCRQLHAAPHLPLVVERRISALDERLR